MENAVFPDRPHRPPEVGVAIDAQRSLVSEDLPKLEILEGICRRFPQFWREEIAAALLVDLTTPAIGESIKVITMREGEEQTPRYEVGRDPEGSDLRKALLKLERWGLKDESVEAVILSLAEGYDTRRRKIRQRVNENGDEAELRKDLAEAERRVAAQEEQPPPTALKRNRADKKRGK